MDWGVAIGLGYAAGMLAMQVAIAMYHGVQEPELEEPEEEQEEEEEDHVGTAQETLEVSSISDQCARGPL